MTITLSSDIAAAVQGAVSDGEYASSSEVIREALRDWKLKREFQQREFEALKADIEEGLADLAAGRVTEVNVAEIVEEGRRLLAARARSGGPLLRGETWSYLASEASEALATRIVEELWVRFDVLRQFSQSGPARDTLALGLRDTFHRAYAIYYSVDDRLPAFLVFPRNNRNIFARCKSPDTTVVWEEVHVVCGTREICRERDGALAGCCRCRGRPLAIHVYPEVLVGKVEWIAALEETDPVSCGRVFNATPGDIES